VAACCHFIHSLYKFVPSLVQILHVEINVRYLHAQLSDQISMVADFVFIIRP